MPCLNEGPDIPSHLPSFRPSYHDSQLDVYLFNSVLLPPSMKEYAEEVGAHVRHVCYRVSSTQLRASHTGWRGGGSVRHQALSLVPLGWALSMLLTRFYLSFHPHEMETNNIFLMRSPWEVHEISWHQIVGIHGKRE